MTIYFCSGHRDLSESEFQTHYVPQFSCIQSDDEKPTFIMGDCEGADLLCYQYIINNHIATPEKVVVYHMFDRPRGAVRIARTKGGYTSDRARDTAMTTESDVDIVWHRPIESIPNYNPTFKSGVMRNILRRHTK
jgi:hypothetical protein